MKQKTSKVFDLIIARAIVDNDFKQLLFKDKKAAIKEYQLTDADLKALDKLDERALNLAKETAGIVGMVCSVGRVAGKEE